MVKKIIGSVLVIAVIAALVYWFNYTKEIRTPVSMAINAVPTNAAFVVEVKHASQFWEKVSGTNIMWEQLLTVNAFDKLNKQAKYIASLINKNGQVKQLIDNNPLFISSHITGAHSYDFLYTLGLPSIREQSMIEDFFSADNFLQKKFIKNYDGTEIFQLIDKYDDSICYSFFDGVVMLSTSKSLVESAVRQLKSGMSFNSDSLIKNILNTSGKNTDANVYANYKTLPDVLNKLTSQVGNNKVRELIDFAYFSGWDVSVKPNAIAFNGFTQTRDISSDFLSLFISQKPQEIKMTKILPANTAFIMFWGISNIKTFRNDYRKYTLNKKKNQQNQVQLADINTKYKINIESALTDWNNNEIALIITETHTSSLAENTFAVIHSNDINDAYLRLSLLTDTINKKEKLPTDTIQFKKYTIQHLRISHLLTLLYGKSFENIENTYFCAIGDYIVFGNSNEALKTFITSVENQKTLENDKNYLDFSENISSDASVFVYVSSQYAKDVYSPYFNNEMQKEIEQHTETLNKFDAIALQFTYNKKLFFSNAYLRYNPNKKEESNVLWELKLDAPLSSTPYILLNHNTKTKELFVQDVNNKVYLISNTGKVLWSKQLQEQIKSDVVQIDIFKNQKLQILFNTKSAIHAIDRNGKDVAGYPIKLKSQATAALAVFDYENNRNYRILIPCESKKILCYDANGREVKGFRIDKITSEVNKPLQYFKVSNKDLLCAVDEKGKIYIVNRKGEAAYNITEHLFGAKMFFIEEGKDIKNTYIVGCDSVGNVMKISLSNQKETFQLTDDKSINYFDYTDISGDNIKEYIFIIKDKMKVYAQNKQLLFEYEFNEPIQSPPFYIKQSDKSKNIGALVLKNSELFLFNSKGDIKKGFPIQSVLPLTMGDINNDGVINTVTIGVNGNVIVYQ